MKIEVLGTGCTTCNTAEAVVREAVEKIRSIGLDQKYERLRAIRACEGICDTKLHYFKSFGAQTVKIKSSRRI